MIKVLIADDHTLIRKGLKQILDDSTDMRVTVRQQVAQAIQWRINDYDTILLDISLPDKMASMY
jgi:DNA-binding NarL/FixJ family response regulator